MTARVRHWSAGDEISYEALTRTSQQKTTPSGAFVRADDGTRTHDLLHGKQTL
jgi:hypothetical protein